MFRSSCVKVYPKVALKYNETLGPPLGIKHPNQDTDTRCPLLFFVCSQVMDYWNHTDFTLSAHPSRDIAIITGADDIITAVEESQVTLSNIRGSRFVTPIKV